MQKILLAMLMSGPIIFVIAVEKEWQPNTNYWNAENWSLKRIPTRKDCADFSSETGIAVALQEGSTMVGEIILPIDGELIFPSFGELMITGERNGKDNDFIGGKEFAWLDSKNWALSTVAKNKDHSAIPHAERIPCSKDKVVFPNGSSFKVRLPEVQTKVGAIYIHGQRTSAEDLQHIVESDTGVRLFKGNPRKLIVQDETCTDINDCVCNNHQNLEVMDVLCSYEKTRCEERLPCEIPIQPVGHCCKICGAYIIMQVDRSNLPVKALQSELRKHSPSLAVYMSLIKDTEMQMVLIDLEVYKGESSRVASKLVKALTSDRGFEGVREVTLFTSGEAITSWGSTGGIIFVTFFTVIVLLGLGALLILLGYHRHVSGGTILSERPSFLFARFENSPSDAEGELEIGISAGQEAKMMTGTETVKAFDNPMFDQPGSSTSNPEFSKSLMAARPKASGTSVTVENPTYKALQASALQQSEEDETIPEKLEDVEIHGSSNYEALKEEE